MDPNLGEPDFAIVQKKINDLEQLNTSRLAKRLATTGEYLTPQELGLFAAYSNMKVVLISIQPSVIAKIADYNLEQIITTETAREELGDTDSDNIKYVLISPNSPNTSKQTHFSTLKVIKQSTTRIE